MNLPVKNIVSEIDLTPSDALLPIFEIVVNSIISLKLTNDIAKAERKIQVQLFRGGYSASVFNSNKVIASVKVIDNGEGFTDANLESFKTAYSRKNKELGCKGVGRFTVLAAFEQIYITSSFKANDKLCQREIQFDASNEVVVLKDELYHLDI